MRTPLCYDRAIMVKTSKAAQWAPSTRHAFANRNPMKSKSGLLEPLTGRVLTSVSASERDFHVTLTRCAEH